MSLDSLFWTELLTQVTNRLDQPLYQNTAAILAALILSRAIQDRVQTNAAKKAQKALSKDEYSPGEIYQTFVGFRKTNEPHPNGGYYYDMITDPVWCIDGPQIGLSSIFKSHSGYSAIMQHIAAARDARLDYDLNTLTVQILRDIFPEEFEELYTKMKQNWDVHCRSFLNKQLKSDYLKQFYEEDCAQDATPHIFYPCLFYGTDGQGRIIFVDDNVVQGGAQNMPRSDQIKIWDGKRYIKNEDYKRDHDGQDASKMKRYYAMVDFVTALQSEELQESLGIICENRPDPHVEISTLPLETLEWL